jgi:hypothetical protein
VCLQGVQRPVPLQCAPLLNVALPCRFMVPMATCWTSSSRITPTCATTPMVATMRESAGNTGALVACGAGGGL